MDSTLAGNLIIVNVPSPWSHSYGGGILALSGGSIGPGGSVRVTVSLNRYFEDGEYAVSSVGTTSVGEVSLASGPLLVGELYLLNVLGMASSYRFPLVALVGGLGFLELFLSRRARAPPSPPRSPPPEPSIEIDIYSDSACTRVISNVVWGNIQVGSSGSRMIYVKNSGDDGVTLILSTENWSPVGAASYLQLSWNYDGSIMAAGEVRAIVVTLSVAPSVSGVDNFNFDIVITGTAL